MGNEDHGYNSPSQLWRCKLCPGSVNLLRSIVRARIDDSGEETGSIPAVLGTWKHDITPQMYCGEELDQPPALIADIVTDKDYEEVEWVVSRIREIVASLPANAFILWEHQMDLSGLGIDGSKHGCRADALVIVPSVLVVVIDMKYGFKWVAGPRHNPQFQAYGWGGMEEFGGEKVWAHKLQPKLPENMRHLQYTFGFEEMQRVEVEIKGIIEATKDPEAPLCRGDHCVFCCKLECPQWRDTFLAIPKHLAFYEHLNRLDPVERGSMLDKLKAAKVWVENAIKALTKWGFDNRDGSDCGIDGFEICLGNSSHDWADPVKARKAIREIMIIKNTKLREKGKPLIDYRDLVDAPIPATPKSSSQVFKKLGRAKWVLEILEPMIVSTPGAEGVHRKKND